MIASTLLHLGVLTTRQLTALGWSKWAVEREVGRGGIERLRPGWFALPAADARASAAVRAGGCIACLDALAVHGVWVPPRATSHIRVAPHSRTGAAKRRCAPYGAHPPIDAALDDVATAVRCAARCATAEELVAVLDSVLHLRLATEEELRAWLADAPVRVCRSIDACDGRSESGTETLVRTRLRAARIAVRPQVWVGERMRVDLLVGDRLVIECDSRAHHTDMRAYESDRAGDRQLVARGYLVVRLTYQQVLHDWPAVVADLRALVRKDAQRWLRRRRNQG